MTTNDDPIIIAFIADYDEAVLSIHGPYETWADACADARRRNNELGYQLMGIEGQYAPYYESELY